MVGHRRRVRSGTTPRPAPPPSGASPSWPRGGRDGPGRHLRGGYAAAGHDTAGHALSPPRDGRRMAAAVGQRQRALVVGRRTCACRGGALPIGPPRCRGAPARKPWGRGPVSPAASPGSRTRRHCRASVSGRRGVRASTTVTRPFTSPRPAGGAARQCSTAPAPRPDAPAGPARRSRPADPSRRLGRPGPPHRRAGGAPPAPPAQLSRAAPGTSGPGRGGAFVSRARRAAPSTGEPLRPRRRRGRGRRTCGGRRFPGGRPGECGRPG